MPARVVIQDPELNWKGQWDPSTTYPAESVVGYEGSSWVTEEVTQGDAPTDGAPWALVAAKGDQGPEGPQGVPGAAGSAPQAFHHVQGIPSDTWVLTHNLGYRPAGVLVEDSGGTDHEPLDVEHPDIYTTILYFSFPFGGIADLS